MSACEDLDGPAHVETALAKRPFTLRPVAGNAHGITVATLTRGVKGSSNGSLLSNAQAQRRAAGMPRGEGTLSFRIHPSAVSEATPRVRCSLLLGVNAVRTLCLLAPVLLWCQRFRAAHRGLHAPDSGTGERANHPGGFGLDRVRGLKSMR